MYQNNRDYGFKGFVMEMAAFDRGNLTMSQPQRRNKDYTRISHDTLKRQCFDIIFNLSSGRISSMAFGCGCRVEMTFRLISQVISLHQFKLCAQRKSLL